MESKTYLYTVKAFGTHQASGRVVSLKFLVAAENGPAAIKKLNRIYDFSPIKNLQIKVVDVERFQDGVRQMDGNVIILRK